MKSRSIPFGYAMQNGQLVPHPKEADCVRQIYSLYISGLGYKAIVKRLNDDDIPYHPGKPWNQNMVARILENRRYLGERSCPALISAANFHTAAALKAAKHHSRQQRRKTAEPFFEYRLLPYEPTAAARRMTSEINRALERTPDPKIIRPLIFACAAEKYNAIGVIIRG